MACGEFTSNEIATIAIPNGDSQQSRKLKMPNKDSKFAKKVINELFKRVGFKKFDQKFVDSFPMNWYAQKEWTEEDEKEFKEWYADQHQKAFKSTRALALSEASWFLFNYGWKVKYEDSNN